MTDEMKDNKTEVFCSCKTTKGKEQKGVLLFLIELKKKRKYKVLISVETLRKSRECAS